jgi:hypothetical protein
MNTDLVNLYIEKLLSEITESVKTRILLQTQLTYTERLNSELQQTNDELKREVAGLQERIIQVEANLHKKVAAKTKDDF